MKSNKTLNEIFTNNKKLIKLKTEAQGVVYLKLQGNNVSKSFRINRGKRIIYQKSFQSVLNSGKLDLSITSEAGGIFSILVDDSYACRFVFGPYEKYSYRWNGKLNKTEHDLGWIRITEDMQNHNTKSIEQRSFFLDYVAKIDTELDERLSNYFLRKLDDFDLWLQLEDQTRMSLSDKKIILSKILKYRFPQYKKRKELIKKFDGVITLRNRFAHSMQMLTLPKDVKENKFQLRDYNEKTGKMIDKDVTFHQVREQIDALLFIQGELIKIDILFSKDRMKN